MKWKNQYQMYIKSLYFDLSDRFLVDSTTSILNRLAAELVHITDSSCAVIYAYNPWMQTFDQWAQSGESSCKLKDRLICEKGHNPAGILQSAHPEMAFQVMNITTDMQQTLVAISRSTGSIPDEDWQILEVETSSLLQRYARILHERSQNNEISSLFDSAVNVNELSAKSDIWLEIRHMLKRVYPECDYELLLSQDYQIDHVLPVQMIADADDVSKQSGSKAFMTGEIVVVSYKGTTAVYAPLVGDQGVYGVLKIIFSTLVQLPKRDRDFLMRFCDIVGKALEKTAFYEQSNQSVSNMKWLIEVTQQLNRNLDLNEIIPMVRDRIIELSQASQLGIVLMDENKKGDGNRDIQTESTTYFHTDAGRKFTQYIKEKVFETCDSILTGNMPDRTDLTTYGSVMAIPLNYSNKLDGMIIALHETNYYFSLETMKVAQTFIQHSSLAVDNALLKAELKKNTITDDLTDLYTRRYVDEEVIKHMDIGTCGILIFFDIDNFKYINDTYGHHIGDEVIIQIATILKRYSSQDGWACRWGGEELAVYLPGYQIDQGSITATSILKATAYETNPSVTLSCGISAWNNQTDDTARGMFTRADQALYEAKNTGKNKIVVANHMKKQTEFVPY